MKKSIEPTHEDDDLNPFKDDASAPENESSDFGADSSAETTPSMLDQALSLIIETKRVTASSFQRRLGLSLEKIDTLFDHLEKHNIIAGPNGEKPREILIDVSEELPEVPPLPGIEPRPVIKTEKMIMITQKLSQEKFNQAASDLVKAEDEIAELQEDFKLKKSEHKAKVEIVALRASKCKAMVRDQVEEVEELCDITLDYEKETYLAVRKDNGAIVEKRAMTSDELSELPMGDCA